VSTNQQESPELLLARDRLEAQIIKITSDITDDSLFDVQWVQEWIYERYRRLTHVCNGRSQDEALTIEAATTALQVVRPLDGAFESIIEAILHAMDADAVAVRTKAIRSLGAVITSDMSLLTIVSLLVLVFAQRNSQATPSPTAHGQDRATRPILGQLTSGPRCSRGALGEKHHAVSRPRRSLLHHDRNESHRGLIARKTDRL
jgi:hypothetical protein